MTSGLDSIPDRSKLRGRYSAKIHPRRRRKSYIANMIGVVIIDNIIIAVKTSELVIGSALMPALFMVCNINKPNSPPWDKINAINVASGKIIPRTRDTMNNAKNFMNTNPTRPTKMYCHFSINNGTFNPIPNAIKKNAKNNIAYGLISALI